MPFHLLPPFCQFLFLRFVVLPLFLLGVPLLPPFPRIFAVQILQFLGRQIPRLGENVSLPPCHFSPFFDLFTCGPDHIDPLQFQLFDFPELAYDSLDLDHSANVQFLVSIDEDIEDSDLRNNIHVFDRGI